MEGLSISGRFKFQVNYQCDWRGKCLSDRVCLLILPSRRSAEGGLSDSGLPAYIPGPSEVTSTLKHFFGHTGDTFTLLTKLRRGGFILQDRSEDV